MKQLHYRNKPIASIDSLAAAIGFPASQLAIIADDSQQYYLPNPPFVKPNGKLRQTYTVRQPLKDIQDKILHKIISEVDFPGYLQGAIRDPDLPRDYVRDAFLHLGRTVILHEDISTFFASSKESFVFRMWKSFFHFQPDVASVLTKLTTYNGFIPEGASTSPAIAI